MHTTKVEQGLTSNQTQGRVFTLHYIRKLFIVA